MQNKQKKYIYLDYASGVDNPSAIHSKGVGARKIVEDSRKKIAHLMGAHMDEIIFTGSGTESIALAILGLIAHNTRHIRYNTNKKMLRATSYVPHVITTNIEHPAVQENCKMLEERGEAEVTYVPVEANGIVDPRKIREAIREDTVLVSVGYANNEIGTIQPIREIAKEIRHFRKIRIPGMRIFPLFHTDACQAMNYLETDNMDRLGVDLLSFNSSKIGGPQGVGVLYKKRGIDLTPLYVGGGQEFGLRSGTENVEGIAGVAKALEQVCKIKNKESKRLIKLRDYAIKKLLGKTSQLLPQQHSHILQNYRMKINGDLVNRLPNNINISISGISSELLVIELDAKNICVSERSACGAKDEGISHVIRAIGGEENNSIRISLGRSTTKKDLDYLISSFQKILKKYRDWK